MIRLSEGTAAAMKLNRMSQETSPSTAYFLVGERCLGGCAFCPQGSAGLRGERASLGRVGWPAYPREEVEKQLAGPAGSIFQRICLQGTRDKEGPARLIATLSRMRGLNALPISISAWIESREEAGQLFAAGAERLSIALDAVNPLAYARLKGGSLEQRKKLLLECAHSWPGRMTAHIICGLGESDEELLGTAAELVEAGVRVALFAFTPLKKTQLSSRPPPRLGRYRRIQAACYLLQKGHVAYDSFRFQHGELCCLGLPENSLRELLHGGDAFRTSGCPGCNRPYYNERPGGAMYNCPRPLGPGEQEQALEQLLQGQESFSWGGALP